MSQPANMTNLEKQSSQASIQNRKDVLFYSNISRKFPGVKVFRIQDSWLFEVPEGQMKVFTDELESYHELSKM